MSRKPLNRGAHSIEYLDSILSVLTQEVTNRNCNCAVDLGVNGRSLVNKFFAGDIFFVFHLRVIKPKLYVSYLLAFEPCPKTGSMNHGYKQRAVVKHSTPGRNHQVSITVKLFVPERLTHQLVLFLIGPAGFGLSTRGGIIETPAYSLFATDVMH